MPSLDQQKEPTVSVIIPCYNRAHLLPGTLASLQAQTFRDWEALLVDDGSRDTTAAVVKAWADRDARFKFVAKPNTGVSATRNLGLELAQGRYIQFLDSDDFLAPRKLEEHSRFLDSRPEIDVVYSAVDFFREPRPGHFEFLAGPLSDHFLTESGSLLDVLGKLVVQNGFVINSPLVRRSSLAAIGKFDVNLGWVEDWEYWLRLAFSGARFAFLDAPDLRAQVRVHGSSLSNNIRKMVDCSLALRTRIEEWLAPFEDQLEWAYLRSLNRQELAKLSKRKRRLDHPVLGIWDEGLRKIRNSRLVRNMVGLFKGHNIKGGEQ